MSENGKLIVQDDAVALFDTAKFEQMCKVAKVMAMASLVPKHLQSTPDKNREADCMLVVQQARRWQMDPFALAQCSFVVGGKLGYEGKAIAAVVNSRADLKQRLKYAVTGEGEKCSVMVSGTFKGEDEVRTIDATWQEGFALSQSGAKWKELPDQQLCYYAARKWARRHAPELIMGVLSNDEIQAMQHGIGPDYARDVTPQKPIASLDALADQIETKAAPEPSGEKPWSADRGFVGGPPEPQDSHQEAGDDIIDTDTGEVTEGAPEQPQPQHGMAHEQTGFDLEPEAIEPQDIPREEGDEEDAKMAYWLSAQIVKARSKDRMLKDLEPKIIGLKGKIPAAQYTALINAFQEKFEVIQKSEKAA